MNSFSFLIIALIALFSTINSCSFAQNNRPIIGILTQPYSGPLSGTKYLAASYVKYLESAGARVVPVFHDASENETLAVFNSINGVLFPGGGSDLGKTSQIYQTALSLFNKAKAAFDSGDHFPIWGTCMGFELINLLQSNDENVLQSVDAENYTIPLEFSSGYKTSRMFQNAPAEILSNLANLNITMNNHQFSVYTSTFDNNVNLNTFFKVLSVNHDRNGVEFVSTIEGFKYPVYATQWHPEKNQFEWVDEVIDHSSEAILTMQYMANFLVSEARKSQHFFPSAQDESSALIYNFSKNLQYTGTAAGASFEQTYIW